jgi:AraC family transcriptional regulator, regulatory protein of adaptative response / methylated-DNA-[protein]-cysteine methyltransferase
MQPTHDHRDAINRACRRIASTEAPLTLATLAADAGLSASHFQRLFAAVVGLSPKQYAIALRQQKLNRSLRASASVTDAIYDAGYAGSSAAYRDSQAFGMAPKALRTGGARESLRYACAATSLGPILVAATERGICMVEFGPERELLAELSRRFPKAIINGADKTTASWISTVVAMIDHPATHATLPLDILGTAFQIKVWNALRKIEPGETVSYSELARRIRAPSSTRAVARACATNSIAVLVPCHRVISATGELTGYKWGIERKRALLQREGCDQKAVTATRAIKR